MNRWVEVSLRVDGEAAEAVAEILQRYGHQGVSIEQDGILPDKWDETDLPPPDKLIVRAYFPEDHCATTTKKQLETALGHMRMMYPMPEPIYQVIYEDDWAEAWKAHYHPVRIGKNILIRPAWIDIVPRDTDIVISLDPGMAFGTGTHPTTQLCLEALEDLVQQDQSVLDLGCGSGILSIAAAKLGTKQILAVDIDPIAVKTTRENSIANQVASSIITETGSLEEVLAANQQFDLVVVNILARIILAMCENRLGDVVRPGGKAIFSGIITDQVEDVKTALIQTGLHPIRQQEQGDWVLIETVRQAI